MEETTALTEVAIVVVAALAGGLGFARLGQPLILGYILAGILLGPSGMGLINSRDAVSTLAEMGVLLLLFVIGMELNLRTFKRVWVVATSCTILQILTSLILTMAISKILALLHLWDWSWHLALLLGFVVAMSSTAVVVKMLESIGELRTDVGQIAIGVLIAQDLAIVPMILILKTIKNVDTQFFDINLILKLIVAIGLIGGLIAYLSRKQRVKLPLTAIIAGEKDLTPLASLTFCFAAAALSGLFGLSAAYGAFLAGLILGNTQERLIMIETTKPIQSILLMVFFLSIGLLLDLGFIWEHLGMVIALLLLITFLKSGLNILILHVLRVSWSQAFLVGLLLAQLGEFAFLLSTIGRETKIMDVYGEKLIIALTVLSLAFSPLWLSTARRIKTLLDKRHISFKGVLNFAYQQEMMWLKRIFRFQANRPSLPPAANDGETTNTEK